MAGKFSCAKLLFLLLPLVVGCPASEVPKDPTGLGLAEEPQAGTPETNLERLRWRLPPLPPAIGTYVPAVRTGNLLFVSGQLPMRDGNLVAVGRVGDTVTEVQAKEAMRVATLNALAVIRTELGSLNRVRRVVRVVGYVACTPEFGNQPQVVNAASEMFLQLFGRQRGSHARLALGAASLPKNSPVELEVIVEVER